MWSSDWPINTLKQLDRECRKIIQEYGGLHVSESTKAMYLPTKEGGRGLKEVEMTYKVTKIKTANYIIHSQDPRIQLVKRFEERKATKGLKSVLKDAKKYTEELDVAFTYDETKTTLTSQDDRSRESKPQTDRRIPNANNKQPLQNRIQRTKVVWRTNYSTV